MLRRSSKVSLRGDSARDSFSSYLLKRSGGHEGHTTLRKKFQERFFVCAICLLLEFFTPLGFSHTRLQLDRDHDHRSAAARLDASAH